MSDTNKNSYRSIFKWTAVFGGLQVFQILISLIRGKFVALLLGPMGMGISSLFTTSLNTIVKFSSLGLNLAIVKDVAEKSESGNGLGTLIGASLHIVKLTALAGALVCALASPLISRFTFGTTDYWWQFILLSVAVYLTVSYSGKLSVLQGLHQVKRMSRASLVGAATGLVAGVPIYYFWGNKGIVPAIVVLAVTMYVFYEYNLRKTFSTSGFRFKWREHKAIVKGLIGFGLIFAAGDIASTFTNYIVNICIRHLGGLDSVGLFQAANSITNQYSAAIFAAMSLDYFPRLSAAASDNRKMSRIVSRQSETVSLMIAPMTLLLILTAPLIIKLLLTSAFNPVLELIRLLGVGILFRGLQFPLGYIVFAKDNRELFIWLEIVISNFLTIGMTLLFFHLFGLNGIGYAVIGEAVIVLILYAAVNNHYYGFRIEREVMREYAIAIVFTFLCFSSSYIPENAVSYSLMSVFTIASITYSVLRLRKLFKRKESDEEEASEEKSDEEEPAEEKPAGRISSES